MLDWTLPLLKDLAEIRMKSGSVHSSRSNSWTAGVLMARCDLQASTFETDMIWNWHELCMQLSILAFSCFFAYCPLCWTLVQVKAANSQLDGWEAAEYAEWVWKQKYAGNVTWNCCIDDVMDQTTETSSLSSQLFQNAIVCNEGWSWSMMKLYEIILLNYAPVEKERLLETSFFNCFLVFLWSFLAGEN